MDASGLPVACNSCQHEFAASLCGKQVKAKALDCKHNLCSECFSARIRILAKDHIMILKCPVSSCKTITTRALPAGFCGSSMKHTVRRNMGSNVKMRSKSGVEEKKKQFQKDILLEQFTDVPIPSTVLQNAPSVLHTDIEWLIYGVKVLYTVVILAVTAGFTVGFETVFSNPVAYLENPFSSTALPFLVAILLAVEFVPEDALLAHRESMKWFKIWDLLLILVLSVGSCSTVHFGSAHALSQYLPMALSSHFLILLVTSVLVLKCASAAYNGVVQLGTIICGIYTSIRYSSYMVNILSRLNFTAPAITPQVEFVYSTPKKQVPRRSSAPSNTVITTGLEYDSRYVCAPLLCIDYPEYSELTDYSEPSEQPPLTYHTQIQNTLTNSMNAIETTTTTLSTADDCADALIPNNTNNTITTTIKDIAGDYDNFGADLSPTTESDTTQDIVAKLSMNMLADGYPWDEGVILTTHNNTNKMDTNSAVVGGKDTKTTLVVPSTSTCVIYSDVEGLGIGKEDEIVNHIAFQPTTANGDSVHVDTTPVEYSTSTLVEDSDLPNEDTTEHTITSDNDIDTAYALNCIYINPYEVELAMEKECLEQNREQDESEYTLRTYPSPSTYNPIHSTSAYNVHIPEVPSSSHSPVSSTTDVNSLQYSDSNRSTPVTPTTHTDTNTGFAESNTPDNNNTTFVTPYAMTSVLDSVDTVDVYKNPAPLFRVPKNPSPNQDLFVSPVETPVKSSEASSSAVTNTTSSITTAAPDGANTNADKLITSITSMYAHVPVYITPTKSIRSQWQHNTNTPRTTNMYQTYNSSILHSPLYPTTSSIANTPTMDSPDDEFRLRSNIKLKPLGRLSFGAASDAETPASDKASAYHNFVEHPISPEPHQAAHTSEITNNTINTTSAMSTTTSSTNSTTSNSVVNSTNSMQVKKEAPPTTTTTTKNNKNTTNKEKKGNTQGLPRWKSILGPGNLIR